MSEAKHTPGPWTYLRDRNAMHEAFWSLDDSQKVACMGYLYEVSRHNHHDKDVALAMATLIQWESAILRALNKWEES